MSYVKHDFVDGDILSASDLNDIDTQVALNETNIEGKVDKETGKGLSTEDYTTAEKTKLSGLVAVSGTNDGTNWSSITIGDVSKNIPSGGVSDVEVNGTSVVTDGVANVPLMSDSTYGVAKTRGDYGVTIVNGCLRIAPATNEAYHNRGNGGDYAVAINRLDLAMVEGLAYPKSGFTGWTDETRALARQTLGITSSQALQTERL